MKNSIATAYVQIIPSADGMKARLKEIIGENMPSGEEPGNTFGGGFASKLKSAIAAAGIGAALKTALTEGAALEQSVGGIETLFKDSADTVIANAKRAYETAGMSANEYMTNVTSFSASLLQGLGGDTEKAAQIADMAMQDMSDNANKMGTDMESIQNAYQGFAKQNYTMLDNLKLGYGGTKTEMERLLADAQELTGVEYNIDNLSDVYSAIHAIQENLEITGTTANEAASTLSGSFAAMKSAAQNFLGYLVTGEDIGPAIESLVSTACTFLFGNLVPALGNIITALPGAIMTFATTAGEMIMDQVTPGAISNASGVVSSMLSTFIGNLPSFISTGGEMLMSMISGLLSMVPELLTAGGDLIANLISELVNNFPAIISSGYELVANLIRGIGNAMPDIIAAAGRAGSEIMKTIQNTDWLQLGKDVVTGIIDGLGSMRSALWEAAWNIAKSIWDDITSYFSGKSSSSSNSSSLSNSGYNASASTAFSSALSSTASAAFAAETQSNGSTTNITFNSPKSMSRREIYRATKHALKEAGAYA